MKTVNLLYEIEENCRLVVSGEVNGLVRRIAAVSYTGNLQSALAEVSKRIFPSPTEYPLGITFTSPSGEETNALYSKTREMQWVVVVEGMDLFGELEKLALNGQWCDSLGRLVLEENDILTKDGVPPQDSVPHQRYQMLQAIYSLTKNAEQLDGSMKEKFLEHAQSEREAYARQDYVNRVKN